MRFRSIAGCSSWLALGSPAAACERKLLGTFNGSSAMSTFRRVLSKDARKGLARLLLAPLKIRMGINHCHIPRWRLWCSAGGY